MNEYAEKKRLIEQMGSKDNETALQAIKELRELGWLEDGTLRGSDLREANLREADLSLANLTGANLCYTNYS